MWWPGVGPVPAAAPHGSGSLGTNFIVPRSRCANRPDSSAEDQAALVAEPKPIAGMASEDPATPFLTLVRKPVRRRRNIMPNRDAGCRADITGCGHQSLHKPHCSGCRKLITTVPVGGMLVTLTPSAWRMMPDLQSHQIDAGPERHLPPRSLSLR